MRKLFLTVLVACTTFFTYSQTGQTDQTANKLKLFEEWSSVLKNPQPLPNVPATVTSTASRDNMIIEHGYTITFTGSKVIRSIQRTITNTSNQSALWTFTTMPYQMQDIVTNIKSQLSNPLDTQAVRMELIHLVAKYLKYSGNWQNRALSPSGALWASQNAFSKWYSPIGWRFSQTNNQCGNYANEATLLLVASGYYTYDEFETVGFNGNDTVTGHGLIHIKLDRTINYFSMVDFDPGEPGLLFPYAGSPNGFASAWDIHNNPQLAIGSTYQGRPWSPYNLQRYPLIFSVDTPHIYPFPEWSVDQNILDAEKGDFMLPGNSTMTFSSPQPIILFDIADSVKFSELSERGGAYVDSMKKGLTAYRDSFIDVLAQVLPVGRVEVANILNTDPAFGTYNSLLDQGKTIPVEYARVPVPTVAITVGSTDSISMPLLLMSVDNPISCGDTSGVFDFPIWGDEYELLCDYKAINYLHANVPSGTHIIAAWNGLSLSPAAEWVFNMQQGNLSVHSTIEFVPEITTAITAVEKTGISFWPNPTTDMITLSEPLQQVKIFNTTGQIVASYSEVQKTIQLSVPAGLYFVSALTNQGATVNLKVLKQ